MIKLPVRSRKKPAFGLAEAEAIAEMPDLHIPTIEAVLRALSVPNVTDAEATAAGQGHDKRIAAMSIQMEGAMSASQADRERMEAQIRTARAAFEQREEYRRQLIAACQSDIEASRTAKAHDQELAAMFSLE